MQFFDLHCDTLTKFYNSNQSLLNGEGEVNFLKSNVFETYKQLFAIFIEDDMRGEVAWNYFLNNVNFLNEQLSEHSQYKNNVILSVEGGAALSGDLSKIEKMRDLGVKALTLTWNGENELGYGVSNNLGLKELGKEAVKVLELNNIVVDVSHLSEKGFYDVAKIAKKPFIATHSNSRFICENKRNLTDEQFSIIRDIKGLVGINFYTEFIGKSGDYTTNLLKHIEHFLLLGGEDVLAIGSDFDGCDIDDSLNSLDKVPNLFEICKNEFGKQITEKIFYNNAYKFFKGM